jgi:hypothetical protein
VPRNVHESEAFRLVEGYVRVAKLDGDAARLLFLQPIGIDAGSAFTSAVLP